MPSVIHIKRKLVMQMQKLTRSTRPYTGSEERKIMSRQEPYGHKPELLSAGRMSFLSQKPQPYLKVLQMIQTDVYKLFRTIVHTHEVNSLGVLSISAKSLHNHLDQSLIGQAGTVPCQVDTPKKPSRFPNKPLFTHFQSKDQL